MTGRSRSPARSSVVSLTPRRRPLLRRLSGAIPTSTPSNNNNEPDVSTPVASNRPTIMPQTADNTTAASIDGSSSCNPMEEEREQAIHVAVRFRPINAKELLLTTTTTITTSTTATTTSSRRPSISGVLKSSAQTTTAPAATTTTAAATNTTGHHRHKSSRRATEEQVRAWSLVAAGNNPTGANCRQHSVIQKGAARKVEGRTVFSFDSVFGEQSSTLDVYHCLAKPLLEAVLRGQHATIFAYGQTGSGKTYTMHGIGGGGATSKPTNDATNTVSVQPPPLSSSSEGIIHMTLQDMFQQMQIFPEREFRVRASFFEIYNEKVRDLLTEEPEESSSHGNSSHHSSRLVQVRGDPSGVHVNCREEVIHNMEEARALLALGHSNRSSASTNMNERSSRSHAIFRITVESFVKPPVQHISVVSSSSAIAAARQQEAAMAGQVMRVAVLNLVDLSGSENARLTGNTGQRQREGGMINQSLLSLSQVIHSLSLPPKKRPAYINYRDSKLTRILQPHLSGNARIAILCCASPSTQYVEETRATLMFASRAKLVQTKPQVNEILDDKVLLKRLMCELEEARQAIRQLQEERKLREETKKEKQLQLEQQVQQQKILLQEKQEEENRRAKASAAAVVTPEPCHLRPARRMSESPFHEMLASPLTMDTPRTPFNLETMTEIPEAMTSSSVSLQENVYNLDFRSMHSSEDLKIPLPIEATDPLPPQFERDKSTEKPTSENENVLRTTQPELSSTSATPQGSSKQGTSSQHSLQVTALPFRIMYHSDDDMDGSYASGKSSGRCSKSDVAMADNVSPRASFVIDRSLGDSSRPRLRSPQSTKLPAEVVIMRESSFRTMPIPDADDIICDGTGNGSSHSADFRARLIDTEQRALFLEAKLEASDDLIESLFVELESARKCIQKLVHRNVHLAALWREAENCLLKDPAAGGVGGGRSRATTSDDDDMTRPNGSTFDDDDDNTFVREKTHQQHLKMLKYAMFLGLIFFLFGNTELFLAVAMFVGLTLEVNL